MKIGIIGAMNEEIQLMKTEMQIVNEQQIGRITYYVGTCHEKEIVLCQSGVGKVNAAMTAQILIDHYQVNKIIFTGVAGALDPTLEIGDIVISTCAEQHDIDASSLGFKRGQIPMFPHSSVFEADHGLVTIAFEAAKELGRKKKVMKGKVLSGDQFIADPEMASKLRKEFAGVCVEMEGAAVAQVAMLNGIPFVIVRSISDKANHDATVNFTEFVQIAARQSNEIVKSMLNKM